MMSPQRLHRSGTKKVGRRECTKLRSVFLAEMTARGGDQSGITSGGIQRRWFQGPRHTERACSHPYGRYCTVGKWMGVQVVHPATDQDMLLEQPTRLDRPPSSVGFVSCPFCWNFCCLLLVVQALVVGILFLLHPCPILTIDRVSSRGDETIHRLQYLCRGVVGQTSGTHTRSLGPTGTLQVQHF